GGQLLLGIELRQLDDPSGQSDPSLDVGMYNLTDSDSDTTNNFDPDHSEYFHPAAGSMVMGNPTLGFTTASITGGKLHAEGVMMFMLPGGIPLPLEDASIDGTLKATTAQDQVRTLENGRLRGAVPAQVLAVTPNFTAGMCPGQTMLDV